MGLRYTTTSILLLGLALLVTSCGAGSTSKSLTRQELVAQADPICRQINDQIAYYSNLKPSNSKDLVSASAVGRAAPKISATERNAYVQLKKLSPPSSMSDDWKAIVASMQTLADDSLKFGEAIEAGDPAETSALSSSATSALQQIRTLSAHNGFNDCSKLQ